MCALSATLGYGSRFFFFFQAEDGIRDLVRSRGLGDVYKRQLQVFGPRDRAKDLESAIRYFLEFLRGFETLGAIAVSYTHLTLPTSDLV